MSSKRLERVSSISVQGMINENMYEKWQPKEKVAPECLTITFQHSEAVRVSGSKHVDRDNELSVSDFKTRVSHTRQGSDLPFYTPIILRLIVFPHAKVTSTSFGFVINLNLQPSQQS